MAASASRAEILFQKALAVPVSERGRYLDHACGEDLSLRKEVESLLRDSSDAGRLFMRLGRGVGQVISAQVGGNKEKPLETVGPYQLLKELGRGGMGLVYLARRQDDAPGCEVALKIVRGDLKTEDFYGRFLSERQILGTLDHPNIAHLLSGGVADNGRPYFVMEYVRGTRIDEYCERLYLPVRDRLKLFLQVGEALAHAHLRHVVHRDLKPSNILVEAGGTAKLLDFGIAKLLSEGAGQVVTRTGVRLMTPEYAAPEQLRSRSVTPATDIYQLGAVLYKLLTGQSPFAAYRENVLEMDRAILEKKPAPPSSLLRRRDEIEPGTEGQLSAARRRHGPVFHEEVNGNLDAIVLKALAKQPEVRYASVPHLLEDIQRHLQGQTVSARKMSPAGHAWFFGR